MPSARREEGQYSRKEVLLAVPQLVPMQLVLAEVDLFRGPERRLGLLVELPELRIPQREERESTRISVAEPGQFLVAEAGLDGRGFRRVALPQISVVGELAPLIVGPRAGGTAARGRAARQRAELFRERGGDDDRC